MVKFLMFLLVLEFQNHLINAQGNKNTLRIEGIPIDLYWINEPEDWSVTDKEFSITARGKTDFFIDPRNEYKVLNAPAAIFSPADTFLLYAKVRVEFHSDYDAGSLLVFDNEKAWAKLCFEMSPAGNRMIVSVVNNNISDDANHIKISSESVFIRMAGLGNKTFAFFYSIDGKYWELVRYFYFEGSGKPRVGFSSQSPTGIECTSTFSEIIYQEKILVNIRDGS
jgi:regulation of enolase protein 1 (concanavalin A-like superfamily)